MARASVIIHTRTRLCDFPSTLAVCPSVIGSSDADKIRKQILSATRSIDSLGQSETRQMIYTCGSYVVAGMVSFLKNLANNSVDDEKFFYDEKGRNIYAFVGFVFEGKNQSTPVIDKKILWDNFKTYMEPVWDRNVLDIQSSNFISINFESTSPIEPTGKESASGITLYTIGLDDSSTFSYWLGQALKGTSVSFCSNITDFRVVKDKPFNIITTTTNNIERIKRDAVSKTIPVQTNSPSVPSTTNRNTLNEHQKKNPAQSESSTVGQNSKNMWLIVGAVLIILALVALLSR